MRKHISIILIAALVLSVIFSFGGVALAAGNVDFTIKTDISEMTEGGSVEFTGTITNNSGSPISDFVINQNGNPVKTIGAPLAGDGETKPFTFSMEVTDAMLGSPIQFDLYSGGGTVANDSVTIAKKVLSIKIAGTPTVNHTQADEGKTVTFTFAIENQGEATLDNIVVTASALKSGQPLNTAFSLSAGQSHSFEYKHTVTAAVTVSPSISYSSGGVDQPAEALDPIELTLVNRKVVPVLTVDNKNPDAGEDVTFTLTVTNEGTMPYTDVVVTMNGEEKDFPTSKLDRGEDYTEDYTMSFEVSTDVQFKVTLKDYNDEMKSVSSNTIRIELPVDTNSIGAKLKLTMNVDRPQLTSAGTINFSGTVSNATEYTLSDVSVDESSIGNVLGVSSMAPGASESINWTADINETTTYTFVLTAKDKDGKIYTVNAEPITVTITSAAVEPTNFEDAAEVSPEPNGFELDDTKGSVGSLGIWAIIAIILVVLILCVGGALLVLWKKGKSPKKTTASKMASAKRRSPGGYRKPSSKKKSSSSKNYRDRNNF